MRDLLGLAREQEAWRLGRAINLIASENVTSPQVRALLGSDFGHRYSLPLHREIRGSFVENAYRGTRFLDEMEAGGEAVARRLFGAGFATLKPLSGHVSGFVVLAATCRRGDAILVVDPSDGGYDGYGPENLPGLLGLRVAYLPFRRDRWNLRVEEATAKIREVKPRLVIVGASLFLFPYDLPPLREACDRVDARLAYDASHVLGLIAGDAFQHPLAEGADLLLGSTHKSLFGPQGGLLASREAEGEALQENLVWRAQDNAHWNRVAALAQALGEAEAFGAAYAQAVIRNARRLAGELDAGGLAVRAADQGYTASPQILLDGPAVQEAFDLTLNDLAGILERNDLIVDAVGRLGTNEVTRMGATEEDMAEVADCILRSARGEDTRKDVARIREGWKLSYVFEEKA
ncbi:MAG: serine hydroxymethyltransferase [Thermoplasmata archaeon]